MTEFRGSRGNRWWQIGRGSGSLGASTMTAELIELLRRRIAIIEDHAWRDRDPAGHLAGLQEISEKISAWTLVHRASVDAQLRHYLTNSSFQKALAHLEAYPAN